MAGFFSLPVELREEVYALVFTTSHACTEDNFVIRLREDGTPDRPPPALMLACKQLYCEAQLLFIMSLKFIVTDNAGLESVQRWLGKKGSDRTVKNIRAVAFTSLEMFRTETPTERRMKWDRQKTMPCRREQTTSYFTGSTDPSFGEETVPEYVHFLQTLPGLQQIELGVKACEDCKNLFSSTPWNTRYYYDLESLTTLSTLKTVKVNLRLEGIRWQVYGGYLKEKEDELGSECRTIKAVLDDGMGLKSWLGERFRETGSLIDVCCFCYGLDTIL
jgi:hypothetical protein